MSNLNLTKDQLRRLQLDNAIMFMDINIAFIEYRWEEDGGKGEYETIDQMRDAYIVELERCTQELNDLENDPRASRG